ncbi:MAG: phosphopantetheine-binding protein [Deltaproteobacteria bacterium]|nr:phosphopantetheine-binding protein [Deltaproteobacteria bacterium]
MNNDAIAEIVNAALIEEFELDPEKVSPDAHIRDDLGLDSLDIVDMVIVLEKAFHFKLHDKEPLTKIRTLGDVYAFIAALRDEGTITAGQ